MAKSDNSNSFKKPKEEEVTSAKRKLKNSKGLKGKLAFLRDARYHQVFGLLFILMSFYCFIAFTSYIFTWRADHDKVLGGFFNLIADTTIKTENWLGKTGAFISHVFIYKWFGISSFLFALTFFLVGFRIVFKVSVLPFWKTMRWSLFFLLFFSTALGYIFKNAENFLFLGGTFGFEVSNWIELSLGKIGTGLFLVFAGLSFAVIAFSLNLKLPSFKKGDNEANAADASGPAENTFSIDASESFKEVDLDVKPEKSFISESVISEEYQMNVDAEMEAEDEIDEKADDGLQMEVVNTRGDEGADEIVMDENDIPADIDIEQPEQVTLGEYDPKLDLSSYEYPHLDLLENYQNKSKLSHDELLAELESNKNRIVETLGHYNIAIEKIKATVGPTVTLFEIVPQAGIRISKIKNLEDDIALSLSALGIRIIAPIPGKGTIGIEVPNQNPEIVSMKTVLASEKFQNNDYDLPIGLGKTISNDVFVTDLAKMPHLLMAGSTGQGKSVGLNAVLVSLLYKKHPSQVKFVLVDPKKVELTLFKTIERHFLAKLPGEEEAIITDTRKVVNTLNSLCIEMDQRYELLKDAQVRNIREYNAKFVQRKLNPNKGHRFLPFIILVIDEFADLIMTAGKEIEMPIARLAQLARAIGIHLIIATQRPSVNIITGTIKANFPARIAFRVTSKIDSRTILDTGGADQLIGRGDMLLSTGADLIRLQCAFVDTPEVDSITGFIGAQRGYADAFLLPEFVGEEEGGAGEIDLAERDSLFEEAARMVVQHQQGSASLLQRRLKLGYNRAGRLIDQLEAAGIIGPFEGSKAREVRCKDPMHLEEMLGALK